MTHENRRRAIMSIDRDGIISNFEDLKDKTLHLLDEIARLNS